MSIKLTVLSEIEQIAEQQHKKLAPLTDDAVLVNAGLEPDRHDAMVAPVAQANKDNAVERMHRIMNDTGSDPMNWLPQFMAASGR